MGILRDLKDINEYFSKEEEKQASRQQAKQDYVKIPYLKIEDGETVQLRFLQELDKGIPSYNEKAGTGFVAIEHAPAANWKRRGVCTIETGQCYGCEMAKQDYQGGWGQKARLYVNVLVKRGENEPEVYVLTQGNGPKSITPWLLDYAGENGITGQTFKLKRKGSGQKTTEYTLVPGKFDETPYDVTQHELVDLNACVREIPYEDQEKFYGVTSNGNDEKSAEKSDEATKVKVDW